MILNGVKQELAIIFIKYIAGVVFLITRSKILVWYKMLLPASNSLNLLKLVENELQMTFSENI